MITTDYTTLKNLFCIIRTIVLGSLVLIGCGEDDTNNTTPLPLNTITYLLAEIDNSGIRGYVTFLEEADGTLKAEMALVGVSSGNTYPSHIHANSAAEEGDIAIDLQSIDGATRRSTTTITEITYEQLLTYDGYINVHRSPTDLTILAQADIGGNALTGNAQQYTLEARSGSDITGTVLLEERVNGHSKLTISLENPSSNSAFPAHLRVNSAAEGGDIVIDLNSVDENTSSSVTTIRKLNEAAGDTPITYAQLLEFDGHINVQRAAEGPVVAQTDIGVNSLTGVSETYPLDSVAIAGISGTATFAERKSGETLVTLALDNTPGNGFHPAHIHANTAVEGGDIVAELTPVDGATGISATHIATLGNGTPLPYERLVRYDGHINVLLSKSEPGTLVGQGDIGGNALTGESVTYPLDSLSTPGIRGEATFFQRNNGLTLAVISLQNTPEGGIHPSHIHANTAAENGPIVISLNPVEGSSGLSKNSIRQFDDGTPVTYEQLLTYDGYLNVHLSNTDLTTLVAQGDIGQNALTGRQVSYPLTAQEDFSISGTATFAERNNGFSLVTLALAGTQPGGNHPAHIHFNSADEGGGIAISLTTVNGATGVSKTNVESLNNNLGIVYEELILFDGYVNVHLATDALNVIVSQGNVGGNAIE